MKKNIKITEGPLLINILRFGVPLMLSSMLQLLFNAIDVVVIGKFAGKTSLAAVSSTGSLVNLVTNLFIGLSVGTNVVVARNIGSKDDDGVKKSVHTSITIAIIAGVLLTIIGYFNANRFLSMMGTPDNVIGLSTIYLKVYFLGMLGTMVYNFGAAILRANGDTKRPMYFLLIAGVLNAAMNLVFVLVFHMDVAGVGLATAISQFISAGLVVWALVGESGLIHLDFHQLSLDKKQLIEIAKIGLPAGIQGTVFSISNVVIQSSVNSFGDTVMAGSGSASSIEGFVYTSMNAFYQTCMTFTSQNIGAKKYDRINKILLVSSGCGVAFGLVLGSGAYYFGNTLLAIYNNDPEVIAAGMVRLSYVGRIYFLCGIMDVLVGSLRGMGKSTIPMICSLLGACAFRLIWIKTVFVAVKTIEMVYISYPISWIITAIAHFIYFLITRKQLDKKIKAEEAFGM